MGVLRRPGMLCGLVVAGLALPTPVLAADIIPDTTRDTTFGDGRCSLREAVEAANTNTAVDFCPAGGASDRILLQPGVYTLSRSGNDDTNANGDLDIIAPNLTIETAAPAPTVIDGGFAGDRVFDIDNPATAIVIDGIEIRHGTTPQFGGAILNDGELTLRDSTLAENSAGLRGGALANIDTASLINVTVSGNTAQVGGGVYADEDANTTLNNVTVTQNIGDVTLSQGGGGLARDNTGGPGLGTFQISNSLIAGNRSLLNGLIGAGTSPDCSGEIASAGYNLIGTTSGCQLSSNTGDIIGELPGLAALTEHGGTTRVHMPNPGSAAVNAGDPGGGCAGFDQLGFSRPRDGRCDIGAVDRLPVSTLTVNTSQDQAPGTPGCSLRDAITAANTNTSVDNCGTGTSGRDVVELGNISPQITRTGPAEDANVSGDLDITAANVAIRGGGGPSGNLINAGGSSGERVLDIGSVTGVEISKVDIAGGTSGPGLDGGAIENSGELLLRDVTLEFNSSGDDGGAIANLSSLVMRNSTIVANTAAARGGALFSPGFASLNNVTIAANTAADLTAGGGIYGGVAQPPGVSVANTVVAGNTPADCGGVIVSSGYSAVGIGAGCSLVSVSGGGDSLDQAIGLHETQFSGGARVRLPFAQSLAVDTANPGSGGGTWCERTDQRGISRPQLGRCDIGSVELAPVTLSVTPGGAGSGTVSGAGIDCGADCEEILHEGAQVSLTAAPADGATFGGWGGACAGTGICLPNLFADATVSAQFDAVPAPAAKELTVAIAGVGSGTVTGPGISCPGDCTESYAHGTHVDLQAEPSPASEFIGWSGDCTGTGACELELANARAVTASFGPLPGDDFTDRVPPETTILSAPRKRSKKRTARLEFVASEPRSTFECSLDGAPFAACQSPLVLKRLSRKRHSFAVRAIDQAKNPDPTPANAKWRVKKKRRSR